MFGSSCVSVLPDLTLKMSNLVSKKNNKLGFLIEEEFKEAHYRGAGGRKGHGQHVKGYKILNLLCLGFKKKKIKLDDAVWGMGQGAREVSVNEMCSVSIHA